MFVNQIDSSRLWASCLISCVVILVACQGTQANEEVRLVGIMSAEKRGDTLQISLKVEEEKETCIYSIPPESMDSTFAMRMNNREVEVVGIVTTRREEKTVTVKQCFGVYVGTIEVVRGEKGNPSVLRLNAVHLHDRGKGEKKKKACCKQPCAFNVTLDETGSRLSALPAPRIARVVGTPSQKEGSDWITVQSFQPLVRCKGTVCVAEDDYGRVMGVTIAPLDEDEDEIKVVVDGRGNQFGQTMDSKDVEILGIQIKKGKERWVRLIDYRTVEEEEEEDDKE